MTRRQRVGAAFAIVLALAAVACAAKPKYKTFYTFTPPESTEAKLCVSNCRNTQLQCQQLEEQKVVNCKQQADLDYLQCQQNSDKTYNDCVKAGGTSCFKPLCFKAACPASDGAVCEASYSACYETCGGKVVAETKCIANCS